MGARMKKITLAMAIMGLGLATNASAANLLVNGSFEAAPSGNTILPGGSAAIPGWTTTNEGVEWFTSLPFGGAAKDGTSVIDLAWYVSNGTPGGGIKQSFATVVGESYTLSFYGMTANSFGRDGTGVIDLLITGSIDAQFGVKHLAPTWTVDDWQLFTKTFVASSVTTTVEFRNRQNAFQHFALVDAVSVVQSSVPEPTSWALMIGGLAVVGGLMRKRPAMKAHGIG